MSIALDQVTKRYQSLPVVNDVSIEIEQGEFLVLLGPSGSGKSTLLRAIAGLVEIDHGRVSLHGRDVTGVVARDRGVGFVFQHYALFRHMSVADNVEFALRVRRMKRADRLTRRRELLKLVALEGMDDRLPTQLSGGQQQRVAVARALAHRPEVLLLDEPFGALDAKIREELRRTIRRIQQELGVTTILVTHDQDEAFAMADRIGVMHQGRLLEVGSPDELYAQPRTRFVATFLGAANLLLGYRRGNRLNFDRPGVRERDAARDRRRDPARGGRAAHRQGAGRPHARRHGRGAGTAVRGRHRTPARAHADGRAGARDARSRRRRRQRLAARRHAHLPGAAREPAHDRPDGHGERAAHPQPADADLELHGDRARAGRGRAAARHAAARGARRRACRPASRCARRARPAPRPACRCSPPAPTPARRRCGTSGTAPSQLLVLPTDAPLPTRIVVLPGAEAGVGALGVAASLLRHIPAESVLLAIHETATPERERASRLRLLLDARSRALSEHGLDLRTELRFGDPDEELARELAVDPNSMLVIGLDSLDEADTARLRALLEGPQPRPVLIVRAPDGTG